MSKGIAVCPLRRLSLDGAQAGTYVSSHSDGLLTTCRLAFTDESAGAIRSSGRGTRKHITRTYYVLFIEVQPADSTEVRIWETGDDLPTDPLRTILAG